MGTPIHGKNAVIYLSPGSGAAIEVSEQNDYSVETGFDDDETTELGDTWKTFVKGVQEWSGAINGNFDTASKTLWNAATAAVVSNFYLYPDRAGSARYYYGTCWVRLGTAISGGIAARAKTVVALKGDGALSVNA